jgi:hypothetical protein
MSVAGAYMGATVDMARMHRQFLVRTAAQSNPRFFGGRHDAR